MSYRMVRGEFTFIEVVEERHKRGRNNNDFESKARKGKVAGSHYYKYPRQKRKGILWREKSLVVRGNG